MHQYTHVFFMPKELRAGSFLSPEPFDLVVIGNEKKINSLNLTARSRTLFRIGLLNTIRLIQDPWRKSIQKWLVIITIYPYIYIYIDL